MKGISGVVAQANKSVPHAFNDLPLFIGCRNGLEFRGTFEQPSFQNYQ
jgi:hypothetical protein